MKQMVLNREKQALDNSWLAHEVQQRQRWLMLSYADRLAWLWQAKQFALRAQQAAQARVNKASQQ